ncbi:MAG: DNA adenine methylase [Oscillospiraceae bacterium]
MNCVLKYPGSKWTYADWIVQHMPPHKFYLEPYFGSGAVFFKKPKARFETISDVDGMVVNYFKAVRDYPEQLARAINLTPYARQEYNEIQENHAGEEIQLTGDCVEDARRFAVRCFQGFGSKMADRCGWKNTKHSNGPINPQVWANVPADVLQATERLKGVQVENADAVQLIRACNAEDCLIYADPPYIGSLRNNKRIYRAEMMDEQQHNALLDALLAHKGAVILSGYENDLYNAALLDGIRHRKLAEPIMQPNERKRYG